MNSIVIYASRHGNTEKVARAIAAGLAETGRVTLYALDEAPTLLPKDTGLVVIGGPTESHGLTKPLAAYLEKIGETGLVEIPVAAFDTRLRAPRWLSGSAARGIARMIAGAGGSLITDPESFFVAGKEPALEEGELERARTWAGELIAAVKPFAEIA